MLIFQILLYTKEITNYSFVPKVRKFIRDLLPRQPQKHGFLFTLKYYLMKNVSTYFILFIGSTKVFHVRW